MKHFLIFTILLAANSSIARNLTAQEMKVLAPIYANFVLAQADTVVSPVDHEAIRAIKTSAKGFNYTDDKGIRVGKVQDRISELEYLMKELKAITPADRRQSVEDVVSGLLNPALSKKLTCTLSYLDVTQKQATRIVTCLDDRGTPSQGDDEGYSELRTIQLNIHDKTLQPQSVLELSTFYAG